MAVSFEVIFQDELSAFASDPQLACTSKKSLLSLINGYEDGKWMNQKFKNFIWDNVALTALSKSERDALADQSQSTLVEAARNLRLTDKDTVGEGSEISEIFLYGVMKQHFSALPVVPKIFYKQNSQDNAKGADGVHIVVDGPSFTLWFGEAKFYSSVEDARLDSVVKSVLESLKSDKLKKENAIICNVRDLDILSIDEALVGEIKEALSPQESIDGLKGKIHIPILILYECETTNSQNELSDDYKEKIREFHKNRAETYFRKQAKKSKSVFKYEDINFHLILFPVPKKKPIVSDFTKSAQFYKGIE